MEQMNRAAIGEHYDGGTLIAVPRLVPEEHLRYRFVAEPAFRRIVVTHLDEIQRAVGPLQLGGDDPGVEHLAGQPV